MTFLTLTRYRDLYEQCNAFMRTTLLITALLLSTEMAAILVLLG